MTKKKKRRIIAIKVKPRFDILDLFSNKGIVKDSDGDYLYENTPTFSIWWIEDYWKYCNRMFRVVSFNKKTGMFSCTPYKDKPIIIGDRIWESNPEDPFTFHEDWVKPLYNESTYIEIEE